MVHDKHDSKNVTIQKGRHEYRIHKNNIKWYNKNIMTKE